MPSVARLSTTVIKSTGLTHPDRLAITRHGVVGDRRFLLTRPDRARLSGLDKVSLLGVVGAWDGATRMLTVTLPDGSMVASEPAPVGPPYEQRLYDRTVMVDQVDHPAIDALSMRAGRHLILAEVVPPAHAGGMHPVSLITTATVDDVGARGRSSGPLDARRFRMTIEIDGAEAYDEDTWSGRRVAIGPVVVRVGDRMPRCALTTMDPDTGAKDFPTLHVLAPYRRVGNEVLLGVYADVEEPGTVAVGDDVRVVS